MIKRPSRHGYALVGLYSVVNSSFNFMTYLTTSDIFGNDSRNKRQLTYLVFSVVVMVNELEMPEK